MVMEKIRRWRQALAQLATRLNSRRRDQRIRQEAVHRFSTSLSREVDVAGCVAQVPRIAEHRYPGILWTTLALTDLPPDVLDSRPSVWPVIATEDLEGTP